MSNMKAVLIKDGKGPIENLYLGEAAVPTLKQGDVLVKINAFGLNRMDILQRNGNYPLPPGASTILGVEFSGLIQKLGDGVSEWQVGDEVYGLATGGGYAEYIAVPQANIIKKPAHLSWVQAASIPENFLTAFQALIVIAQLKQGESVLIHAGASGVGVAAIQIARAYNAKNIIATASTQEKLDWLLSYPEGPNATHAINYKTQDFAEEVKKITGGKGVDVVIDFVGQSHWAKNIDSLAVDGRLTLLAVMSGPVVSSANLLPILLKRLRIEGSTLRARSLEYQANLISRFQKEIGYKITGSEGDGDLRVFVHKVYPWSEIQDAHREMEANKNSGKIIAEVTA